MNKTVLFVGVAIAFCSGSAALAYTAADKGSACKTGAGMCGTVSEIKFMGGSTWGCKQGGSACARVNGGNSSQIKSSK